MAPLLINKDGVSIIIQGREHLPPHVHACYGDDEALVNIRTSKMFVGSIPGKKLKVVQEWLAEENNRALVEENFYELNPRLRPADKTTQVIKGKRKKGK